MAIENVAPYVAGPVIISVNLRDGLQAANNFEVLGYSEDGVTTQFNQQYRDIYSDRNGGTEGPPIDRQYMGATARIPLQLSEFDPEVLRRMMHIISGNGQGGVTGRKPGELPPIGCLQGSENLSFQVLLQGTKDFTDLVANTPVGVGNNTSSGAQVLSPLNFLNCYYDGPIELRLGSKNSVPTFDILALPTTSVVANGGDGRQRLYLERNNTAFDDLSTISIA